jgi:hypothetical protein
LIYWLDRQFLLLFSFGVCHGPPKQLGFGSAIIIEMMICGKWYLEIE